MDHEAEASIRGARLPWLTLTDGPHGALSGRRKRILEEAANRPDKPKLSAKRSGTPWTGKELPPGTSAWDYSGEHVVEVPIVQSKRKYGVSARDRPAGGKRMKDVLDGSKLPSWSSNIDPIQEELDELARQAKLEQRDDPSSDQPSCVDDTEDPPEGDTSILLQPDTRPITEEQLVHEVKGIYAGLHMVEKEFAEIVAQQRDDPRRPLSIGQWAASLALQRTLLYEHHDALLASQHPSASPALRRLGFKYNMPERMWETGPRAFLELLQHQLPQEHDYLSTFLYLTEQMLKKFCESLPEFALYWMECLEDLKHYQDFLEDFRSNRNTLVVSQELFRMNGWRRSPYWDLPPESPFDRVNENEPALFSPPDKDLWSLCGWIELGKRFARNLRSYSTIFNVLLLNILL